ncbi:helix-turn-helix domain-containing protein [Vibrio lentus]|uniref:helix-turn-helix domain-containing protein n=1 Tax=Vibrio lentus TaxID=136468 RepID=UPI0010BD1967|nr:helix-turn-helix domain-containing protein [Vibrio lentus]TKG17753.1 hypothetical protein FCW05_12670 [Vibrio lentus]
MNFDMNALKVDGRKEKASLKYTKETQAKAFELIEQGYTRRSIAQAFKMSGASLKTLLETDFG